MRILLIQPDYRVPNFGFRLIAMPEPLHLEVLAASVSEAHEVCILDMRIDPDLEGTLRRSRPDVVGVTALTTEVYAAREVLRAVKAHCPETVTVVGGHHCTLLPGDFEVPEADALVLGEGEAAFAALLDRLERGERLTGIPDLAYRTSDGRFIHNDRARVPGRALDHVPLPRRDLVAEYRPHYFFLFDQPDSSVATSRGCPYRCNFCSVHEFFGGLTRQMSAARVVEEVRAVDTDHLTFVDDNFMLNHRREREIAERIRAEGLEMSFSMEARTDSIARHPDLVEKWADVGLYAMLLGLEGASEESLTNVNKRTTLDTNAEAIRVLQANGVIIWGAFIVDPQWTADDFMRLRDYVDRMGITHTQFTVLTPLPGTRLYGDRFDELLTHDYTCYDALHAVTPTRLPRETFYQHFASLYQQNNVGRYYQLVRDGRLTIEDCRRGKKMLDALSRWESYAANDPVLRASPSGAGSCSCG